MHSSSYYPLYRHAALVISHLTFLTPNALLGFMLAFGDLAWVPFIYSLQVRIEVPVLLFTLGLMTNFSRSHHPSSALYYSPSFYSTSQISSSSISPPFTTHLSSFPPSLLPFHLSLPLSAIPAFSSLLSLLSSSQARYLVDHDPSLPLWQVLPFSALHTARHCCSILFCTTEHR
jgi:hypothetical protein